MRPYAHTSKRYQFVRHAPDAADELILGWTNRTSRNRRAARRHLNKQVRQTAKLELRIYLEDQEYLEEQE